ncbi:MAG: hypothetical protein ACXADF_01085 [Candidatus Thorarchaeota archaeon]|jgi:hypothetical protein
MRCIGVAGGISLYAHDDSYISYFNSPFIGHRRSSSIDVYPYDGSWDGPAFSPVNGKVVEVRKVAMGKKKVFPSSSHDYAIAIAPEGILDTVVRILHCQPSVSVGDKVSKGDYIGSLIRSRYFCYWTGPHYHIEVMQSRDFQRPSQSYPIIVESGKIRINMKETSNKFECEVLKCSKDIVVCTSRDYSYASNGSYTGHHVSGGQMRGILDAGVPHYKIGGVVGDSTQNIAGQVNAWSNGIGNMSSSTGALKQFKIRPTIRIVLDGELMNGISTHLYPNKQLVKGIPPIFLIPRRYGQFVGTLKSGDQVILTIE